MEREKVDLNGLVPRYEELRAEAKSTIWLAVDGQAAAAMAFSSVSIAINALRLRQLHLH